jgi:hypothetical protein
MDRDDMAAAQRADALTEHLTALACAIIDAGFDVLVAWCWVQDDGNIAKRPAHYHGHIDAHRDKALIAEQLVDPPHRPAGVPLTAHVVIAFVPGSGGCGVLDFDVKDGKPGAETYRNLSTGFDWKPTAAWRSPSGGGNVLFRKPPGARYSNRSPWPGVDVRSDSGWVVAPGNVHIGEGWKWIIGGFDTAGLLPIAMTELLSPAGEHGPRASNPDTVAFIEASPTTSSESAAAAFAERLELLSRAVKDHRHDTMHSEVISFGLGMVALDLRWAIEATRAVWNELGTGRPDSEVDESAAWVVGQEIAHRSANAVRAGLCEPAEPSSSSGETPAGVLRGERAPDPFVIPPLRWLIEGLWCSETYGELAGAEKTLKSALSTLIDVALAGGVSVLGQFEVPEARPVLHLAGEGGSEGYWRRFGRAVDAYGLSVDAVRPNLIVTFDRISILAPGFAAELEAMLEAEAPALVHLDPWYAYAPALDSARVLEVGRVLEYLGSLCSAHKATLLINNHFSRVADRSGLSQITGAGHSEWVDSWLLVAHRSPPDVDAGRFWLRLEVGSRQWGGSVWELDLELGRFDAKMGCHVGALSWSLRPALPDSDDPQDVHDAKIDAAKVALIKVAGRRSKPFIKTELIEATTGAVGVVRAAFNALVEAGSLIEAGSVETGNNKQKTPTYALHPNLRPAK